MPLGTRTVPFLPNRVNMTMTAEEFRKAREILARSEVELIEELSVTPTELAAWEAGTASVPGRHARRLRWMVAIEERIVAVEASGLPECDWARAWEADDSGDDVARLNQLEAHARSCPTCDARERFVEERFGPVPDFPHEGFMRVIAWIMGLPGWAQPAVGSALLVGAIVVVRMVAMAPRLISNPRDLLEPLGVIAAAAVAGACGGGAYSLTYPMLGKLGRTGDYLTGIVCMTAYVLGIALMAPLAFGETLLGDRGAIAGMAIGSVVFGVVIGHMWFWKHRQEQASAAEPSA